MRIIIGYKLVSLPELPPSMEKLRLDGCSELVSLPELPPSLEILHLNDCKKLVSLPMLPSSIYMVIANNCNSLETEITQQLVLQHMLRSRIPYLLEHGIDYNSDFFVFPADHLTTEERGFRTTQSSTTVRDLPISDLCGFIYCIILSKGPTYDYILASLSLDDDTKICSDRIPSSYICFEDPISELISDHVIFCYHDPIQFDRISEVGDHFMDITFMFELDKDKERIKRCVVFPVYATASGVELFSNSSDKIFESESVEKEQLPASKRRRTSPE